MSWLALMVQLPIARALQYSSTEYLVHTTRHRLGLSEKLSLSHKVHEHVLTHVGHGKVLPVP